MSNDIIPANNGEIVLYRPNEETQLEVKLEHDTVWLNRQQMAQLFNRDVKTIGKHIANALREELNPTIAKNATVPAGGAKNATTQVPAIPTVAKFATLQREGSRDVTRMVEYYSLDVILSVGYRVKSTQGILFRAWANNVLKEYLLKGYSVNRQLIALQERTDERFSEMKQRLDDQQQQVEFLVNIHQQPEQSLFATGCMWDAYAYMASIIRSAKEQVILVDNYCDDRTLTLLDQRAEGVECTIHTTFNKTIEDALDKHNAQCAPIRKVQLPHKIHDRFLIIDNDVYLLGNSLKDMGHTLSAAILTGFTPDEVLAKL